MLKTAVVSVVCAVSALGQVRSDSTKPVIDGSNR